MQNLDTQEQLDWKLRCAKQRDIARTAPCFHPGQVLMECYRFHLGPFNITFTQDRFLNPPSWHGAVSLFKDIGDDTVRDEQGRYIFDAPATALVTVQSWDKEERDIAKHLLADVFGELIQPDTQVLVSDKVGFAMHYSVRVLNS